MLKLTIAKLDALVLAELNNAGETREIRGDYMACVSYLTGKRLEMYEFDFLILRLRLNGDGYIVWYKEGY